MPGGKFPAAHQLKHLRLQIEQTERVGDVRAALADGFGNFFLCQIVGFCHRVQAFGFFNRIEVLALHVLDDREEHILPVGQFPDDAGHLFQTGRSGRSVAALPCDDLVPLAGRPDDDRLDDAVLFDRGGHVVQFLFIECLAGLCGVRFDLVDPDGFNASGRFCGIAFHSRFNIREEGIQTFSQSGVPFLSRHPIPPPGSGIHPRIHCMLPRRGSADHTGRSAYQNSVPRQAGRSAE